MLSKRLSELINLGCHEQKNEGYDQCCDDVIKLIGNLLKDYENSFTALPESQESKEGEGQEEVAKEMLMGIMAKSVYGTKLRFILDEYHITRK